MDIQKQLGRNMPQLLVRCPVQTKETWFMYVAISNAGGFSIQSLDSYTRLMKLKLSKFQLDLLFAINSEAQKCH